LAQIAGSYGGLALVGTPAMIADQMEEWLYSAACASKDRNSVLQSRHAGIAEGRA
jgi:alkanesulfonate monooxygenase SsuD/methylene tetrahydromethanopterin reductase-like flavin-dependent oxidoreductase (luciferase family)